MTNELSAFRLEVAGRFDRVQDSLDDVRDTVGKLEIALAEGRGAKEATRTHARWAERAVTIMLSVATAFATIKLKLLGVH